MDARRWWKIPVFLAGLGLAAASWGAGSSTAPLPVEQIIARHEAARGGAAAWHGVQSMAWSGKMDAGTGDAVARSRNYVAQMWGSKAPKQHAAALQADQPEAPAQGQGTQVQLPFALEIKRPGKARLELEFAGKTAVQVFDGNAGWLKRPYLNRDDWEPFSDDQVKASAGAWDLDGPLMDYAARGMKVTFDGIENVDGSDAYRLKLVHRDGAVQHVWIDARSFLDVKVEGTPRRMDNRMHAVWVLQRDFRSVQGLMMPFEIETVVDGYPDRHRMHVEHLTLNPQIDDSRFTKPGV